MQLDAPVYEEHDCLVILVHLHDVCLTAMLRLPKVLGLVAGPPVVVVGVITGSLTLVIAPPQAPPCALSHLCGRSLRLLNEPEAEELEASPFFRSR